MNTGCNPEDIDFRLKPIPDNRIISEVVSFACEYDGCCPEWRNPFIDIMLMNIGQAQIQKISINLS